MTYSWQGNFIQAAFSETAEFYSIDAGLKLDPKKRSAFGQYITPAPIGRFISSAM